ncbi:SDR family NAD(P)-dependent oxidoreductase [Candidatus Woesearchaeota archaeon]|nr:SDR family NAD(P)-dependent oxidoreductase [Candidatus Woesearchaeota archaeon]
MLYGDLFRDKVILITGGTGFLGNKLVQRILPYNPKSIRLFSRDEVKHFHTQTKFNNHPQLRHLIGDVRDYSRLRKALKGVDIVIHAAALKRIDIIEYNVEEAIQTNVLGTLNVAKACWDENVKKAVFVSTDKACSPVNTYGACKFIGERIFTESNYSKGSADTIFLSVRYGNVLDSTGSVIPSFIHSILHQEEITLTDERMTRFLITPNQAVDLIFNSIIHSRGGEIFIPKLNSFKIVDLITVLTKYYHKEIKTKVIGIRPGEKIHEVLINETESRRTHQLENFYVVRSDIDKYQQGTHFQHLESAPLINSTELNSKDFLISEEKLFEALMENKILESIGPYHGY